MGPTLRWQRAILFPTTPNCSPNKSARGDWLASSSTGYHTGTRFDLWSPSAGRDKRGIHPLGSYSITEKEKRKKKADLILVSQTVHRMLASVSYWEVNWAHCGQECFSFIFVWLLMSCFTPSAVTLGYWSTLQLGWRETSKSMSFVLIQFSMCSWKMKCTP